MRLLIFPFGQNVDHDYPLITSFFHLSTLFSFLLLCALAALVPLLFRRQRFVALAVAWFFVQISPSSSIQPILTLICEYRVYAALPGFALFVSSLLVWFVISRRRRIMIAAVIIMIFSLFTLSRNKIWQSERAIWEDSVRKSPLRIRPHNNLGVVYREAGLLDKAEKEFRETLKLDPEDVHALNNLAAIYHQQNRLDEAESRYRRVLALDPDRHEIHFNLGLLALARGNYAGAEQEFKKTIAGGIEHADIYANLGFCYSKLDRFDEALLAYQKALALDPNYKQINLYKKIGILLYFKGRTAEAAEALEHALVLSPDDPLIHANLGTVNVARQNFEGALKHFLRAIELDLADAESHFNAGYIYYYRLDDGETARFYLERCLALQPGHPKAEEIKALLRQISE
jgi:tetratricopeptide (TPR) repeat protein